MIGLEKLLDWLFTYRRNQSQDKREITMVLSNEIDKLADLMEEVLKVTNPDGSVQNQKLFELKQLHRRVWNRWIMILDSKGYSSLNPRLITELSGCIQIAHAAPGAYVEELYLLQVGLETGHIELNVRERFARSIDRLRDMATKISLNPD